MIVLNKNNSILINNDKLLIDLDDRMFLYSIWEVNKISMLNTAQRLINNNLFLVIDTVNEVYMMGLNHPEFEDTVNSELKRLFAIDHLKVIDSMQTRGIDKEFILYKKERDKQYV